MKSSESRFSKVRALAKRPGTDGERQAAVEALSRMPAVPIPRKRLTDKLVKTMPAPNAGSKIYWDAPDVRGNNCTRGFGMRVTAAGARAFILNYRSKAGRDGRITIGSHPDWTLTAARERAKELKRAIDGGADPVKDEREQRAADNVNELCDAFIKDHVEQKLRPRTAKDYTYMLDKHVRPVLGTMKVADVKPADIDKLHRKITGNGAPYRANRTVAVLSKMFNLALRWEMRKDNPCKGVEKNQEHERTRDLTADEYQRIQAVLDAYPNAEAVNAMRLAMYTGQRISRVLDAEWKHFDMISSPPLWKQPYVSKNKEAQRQLPLNAPAFELLKAMREMTPDAKRLFAIQYGAMNQRRISIVKAAGLSVGGDDKVLMHTLRHGFATASVNEGVPLNVVSKLLGHSTIQVTQRYARPDHATMHAGSEAAGAKIAGKASARRK